MAAPAKDAIHFILTGGTIDSFYNGTIDTVTPHKKSIIPSYIESLKLGRKIIFAQICMKDSRQLSTKDRKNVAQVISKQPHRKFIITHGTYTMPDSARFLQVHMKRKNATIIFTGAMIPLSFPGSDAAFNLGYLISEIDHLKPGIYVCMNGRIFSPFEIQKLIGEGRFASIFQL